jgi:hypothetical protein
VGGWCAGRGAACASAERGDGFGPGLVDHEDLVHAHQLEQRAHGAGHLAQGQRALALVHLAQAAEQGAQARAVDEAHAGQVDDHPAAGVDQRQCGIAEFTHVAGVEVVLAQFDDEDIVALQAASEFHGVDAVQWGEWAPLDAGPRRQVSPVCVVCRQACLHQAALQFGQGRRVGQAAGAARAAVLGLPCGLAQRRKAVAARRPGQPVQRLAAVLWRGGLRDRLPAPGQAADEALPQGGGHVIGHVSSARPFRRN